MNLELFDEPQRVAIGSNACVLRGFALPQVPTLLDALARIVAVSPFRHMTTPGGLEMSVALTNCGSLGWTTSSAAGYRYMPRDPLTTLAWPTMPDVLSRLAGAAGATAGFCDFAPDACLVNRYRPGSRMTLHQDRNERDFAAPIVSISLGLPATFLFGGHARRDPVVRIVLRHGDVAVWGGEDRLRFHGVMPLKESSHPLLGNQRINFTLRKAGP